MGALALADAPQRALSPSLAHLAELAVLSLGSPSSQRNYRRYIRAFLASGLSLNREGVQAWLRHLRQSRAGAVTVNVSLAAVRLLAREANARGLLDDVTLGALERIRGVKRSGDRIGNWLELHQVEILLDAAGNSRDKALIACMVGCGLRRAEVCALEWSQWQRRGERWIICDLVGKGGRVRSVPAPEWVAEHVEAYRASATVGRVYEIGPDTAYLIVRDTARAAGLGEVRPHDLRRTCARLMRSAGVPIEQIQMILGHASIQTTERYLGSSLELRAGRAATDMIVLPGRKKG